MEQHLSCCDTARLERLLAEELEGVEADEVRNHLESCEPCRRRLEDLAGEGGWWEDVRELLNADLTPCHETHAVSTRDRVEATGIVARLAPTDDPTKLGRLGSHEVSGVIGLGGAGVVLKATDPHLNRQVAIKVLLPTLAHGSAARRRFQREARAIAAITHQHVVPIFAVDEFDGLPYIVMHYVAGGALQQRIDRQAPLSVLEIVRIGAQVARGLAAAHEQGVIHRDIKPANILLEETVDRVLVSDFGLARVLDDASTHHSGVISGTPRYMSPEQCRGEVADFRSDLFSLGAVMYAMATGRAPFRAETALGVIRKVCDEDPSPLRTINPEIPEWLDAFVMRLLEKDRDQRFGRAEDVADLLTRELSHLQNPTAVPEPTRAWTRGSRSRAPGWVHGTMRRRHIVPAGVGISLVALILAGVFWATRPQEEPSAPNVPWSPSPPSSADAPDRWPAGEGSDDDETSDAEPRWSSDRAIPSNYAKGWAEPAGRITKVVPARTDGLVKLAVDRGDWMMPTMDDETTSRNVNRGITIPSPSAPSGSADEADRWPEFEDRLTKVFMVRPGGTLNVVADRGSITIQTVDDDVVTVEVTRRVAAEDQEAAAKILKRHTIAFEQDGPNVAVRGAMIPFEDQEIKVSGLEITAEVREAVREILNRRMRDVAYRITLPQSYDVELTTAGGRIQVPDLDGQVRVETAGGNLDLGEITGVVWARTSGGSVDLDGSGARAELRTSGGSIRAGDINGSLVAHTSGGSIRVGHVRGPVSAKTGGGGISISGAEGAVEAMTSGGSIVATITKQPEEDCRFVTNGGSIRVWLARELALDIDAHAHEGIVSAPFVRNDRRRDRLQTALAGGGPTMLLRTSAGSIRLGYTEDDR